jgi:hypothetical protein
MRILITIIMFFTLTGYSYAWSPALQAVVGAGSTGVVTDPEIIFYFNCDSVTSGQTPTKGSGVVTIGTGLTAVTGQVGNGIQRSATGGTVSFPASGNIVASAGTIGFWLYNPTFGTGYRMFSDTTAQFKLGTQSSQELIFIYNTTTTLYTSALATSAWTYIEVAWNDASDKVAYRVNGSSWSTKTNTDSAPSLTTIYFLAETLTVGTIVDQIMISNVYQKDLYSVRNSTNP